MHVAECNAHLWARFVCARASARLHLIPHPPPKTGSLAHCSCPECYGAGSGIKCNDGYGKAYDFTDIASGIVYHIPEQHCSGSYACACAPGA